MFFSLESREKGSVPFSKNQFPQRKLGALGIGNFYLMLSNHVLLQQLKGSWHKKEAKLSGSVLGFSPGMIASR